MPSLFMHSLFNQNLSGKTYVAGCFMRGFEDGPSDQAKFNYPVGICFDLQNNDIYVADRKNHRIRKISGL